MTMDPADGPFLLLTVHQHAPEPAPELPEGAVYAYDAHNGSPDKLVVSTHRYYPEDCAPAVFAWVTQHALDPHVRVTVSSGVLVEVRDAHEGADPLAGFGRSPDGVATDACGHAEDPLLASIVHKDYGMVADFATAVSRKAAAIQGVHGWEGILSAAFACARAGDATSATGLMAMWGRTLTGTMRKARVNPMEHDVIVMTLGQFTTIAAPNIADGDLFRHLRDGAAAAGERLSYKADKVVTWMADSVDQAVGPNPLPPIPFPKL